VSPQLTTRASADRIVTALGCGRPGCGCGRYGRTHCPAHADQNPSLSVAERDGQLLVHDFGGCGQREVIAALRARGLWPGGRHERAAASSREPTIDQLVLQLARSQPWHDPLVRELYTIADGIRALHRKADSLCRVATEAGEIQAVWDTLALAAELRRTASMAEAVLDEDLR